MSNSSRPGLWELFRIWLTVGLQSFGGGASTFFLVHQACIKRGWMSEEEFVHTSAISQISPGINLVKLTVLVGHRLRGWPGLISAAAGLLLPSAGVRADDGRFELIHVFRSSRLPCADPPAVG
jgi:chromate transporter